MDPRKRSALTAALSGPKPETLGPDLGAMAKADTFSFPCLAEESNAQRPDDLSSEVDKLVISSRSSLAGSAPTVPRLSNTFTASPL